MSGVKITVILSLTLVLCSCSRFDYEALPLYDEVFVPQEEEMDTSDRKPPPKNPK